LFGCFCIFDLSIIYIYVIVKFFLGLWKILAIFRISIPIPLELSMLI
jgi:hypothetical protein